MYSLINTNFNRTYNPSGRQNALSDIKRLLTSRDTSAQTKACGYLSEVINRYNKNSEEGVRMIEYLLDSDITVFLCEAISNLDFMLFRSIVSCLRLLWRSRRFFQEEHAAHAVTAVLRALAHYASSGTNAAVDGCLGFLCDLLNGISNHNTTSALSHQSAYSAVQLLSCLNSLSLKNPNTVLSSALVLDALISYQPNNLVVKSDCGVVLAQVLGKWFEMLIGGLKHAALVEDEASGMFYVVTCQLGMDTLSLTKLIQRGDKKTNFVQTILTDEQEINSLKSCALQMASSVQRVVSELVLFTKEQQTHLSTDEYRVFLKLLLIFFESTTTDVLPDFCDMMFSIGYLTMLPQVQIIRNDTSIRKASTLVLGELLKVLADKYLNISDTNITCANDIHMGLVELQYGIEKPQSIGLQLQKGQPYSLLIYIYFYCQSSDNPGEATGHLLPYLVEHILKLPRGFQPPPYIVKALWLVYAMSTLSNNTLQSLEERVYLEKATDRLITMLYPDPSIYYTHNPAILLWSFTSQRINNHVTFHVLSQWLKVENTLPLELTTKPTVWELLLNVLIHTKDRTIVGNCMNCLQLCLDEGDEECKEQFATNVWGMLPNVLSKALIDTGDGDEQFEEAFGHIAENFCEIESSIILKIQILVLLISDPNISHLLDLATVLLPTELDQTVCLKTAVILTALFTKNTTANEEVQNRAHFEYICLKLCLYLLGLANNQNDNRVLLTYTNRAGFLASVLSSTNSTNDQLSCAALQLLSYVVHYFTKNNYQPKSVLQIQTHLIIQSLRNDSISERGASLLQLVYMVLNSGVNTPLGLAYDLGVPGLEQQCNALRALMLRIQLMLCCRESKNQSSAGWKTLSSIFKHAIVSKNDPHLVATLTIQPWTHILIQFQLTQHITKEFLTFLHNWLTLLRITVKKSQEVNRIQFCKHSLVVRTMMSLKKINVEDDLKDTAQKIGVIVKEVLDDSEVKN